MAEEHELPKSSLAERIDRALARNEPSDASTATSSAVAREEVPNPFLPAPEAVQVHVPPPQRLALEDRYHVTATYAAHGGVIAAALACWAFALRGTDLTQLSGYGLLTAFPPTYFIAVALLTVGFSFATSRHVREAVLALYAVAFVVVIHGATAVLYDFPRYSWTYKHLGVINYIAEHGSVDRNIDIYQNWPGFFALNAWLSRATGVSPITYAGWAQLFFELINVALVVFALRGITRDASTIWTAVWLFLLANWVSQDYLAPQAFDFVMALVVLGLILRGAPPPRPATTRLGEWWEDRLRRTGWVVDAPEDLAERAIAPRVALVVGGVCYTAAVVTHQLSPLMIIVAVWGFALLTRRLPLWIPIAMTALNAVWLALAWRFIADRYEIFSLDPTARPPAYDASRGLSGLELVRYSSWVLTALMAALAVVGLLRRWRVGELEIAPAVFAFAPLVILILQSYGGEGAFRAYFFALPWLAFFAAAAAPRPLGSLAPPPPLRAWRWAAVVAVATPFFLMAYFGYEKANYITAADVAASTWWEQHAPAGSVLGLIAPNFPSKLTARYPETHGYGSAPSLMDNPAARYQPVTSKDLKLIERMLKEKGASTSYFAITPSERRFVTLYRLLPKGSLARLQRELDHSPKFRRVYGDPYSSIYKLVEAR